MKAKLGLELSKENLEISKAEAETILKKFCATEVIQIDENLLITEISGSESKKIMELLNRLAFTKKAYLILNEAENPIKLEEALPKSKLNFLKIAQFKEIGKSFKISTKNLKSKNNSFNIKNLAKIVYNRGLEDVNLDNPSIEFCAIEAQKSYFCVEIWENHGKFEERRADKRPAPHPTSMNPKLARALVNLAGARKEVLDPFCGSGGILLEAGILGLKTTGIDIDAGMIERAKTNLDYYGITNYTLKEEDALYLNKPIECIVTDVPYGKSSKLKEELKNLVKKFLEHYSKLTKTIVLTCPDSIPVEKQIFGKWKIKKKFSVYVHSKLTRNIFVLESL